MTETFKPRNALVVGATRGIGLAMSSEILERFPDVHVYATWRRQSSRQALDQLVTEQGNRLSLLQCDVSDDRQIGAMAKRLREEAREIDLAVHCAGILHEPGVSPEKSVRQLDRKNLHRLFDINTIGPLMVAAELLPCLPRQGQSHFAALSAMIGSIEDNRLGGWYGYRASKTALNQCLKTFAIEARRTRPELCVSLVHPGTTDTGLSKPFQSNVPDDRLYTPQQSAKRVLDVILAGRAEHSGRFMNWDGKAIPY